MKKAYLLTPGPTPVPDRVSAILGQPIIHHRTPQFQEVMARVRVGLQELFQTKQEVMILSSSGTGAMEAAACNLFSRGERVITVNAGKFGARWTKLAEIYGLSAREIKLEPGQALDLRILQKTLSEEKNCRGVLFQASETSTGARMPVREIVDACKRAGVLSVCDAITACGVFDLPMDAWGIDCLMTGSQKALMVPPGLAFIALSARAWEAQAKSDLPKMYFDLARAKKAAGDNSTPWTPATGLILALDESLKMLKEEGLQNVFKRHEILAEATRAGVKALGLEILAKDSPSPAVTGVRVPASIKEGKRIPKLMRDKFGVTIAGGQDELEGKIFRLSHFGYCDRFDITTALSALELALAELGHPVTFGAGVGAALKVFKERFE